MRKTSLPTQRGCKKRTRPPLRLALMATPWLLAGCAGIQSALDPRGPQARAIADLAWAMFWGAAAILLLVMALALWALLRPAGARAPSANRWIAAGGVALPVVVLSALLAYGTYAMGELRTQAAAEPEIEVVANQWWWEVRYRTADGQHIVSANEIRIPAGRPIVVALTSNDVIHSFWVPSLTGKMDLIPGRSNRIVLHADKPGMFRGQCAEYCGAQHARMALHVVTHAPQEYDAWLAAQRAPAPVPKVASAVRGREVFARQCLACHTVRGLGQARQPGPDLTHVASRHFLAAGTLYNNRENLIALVSRSQDLKPGNAMPSHPHIAKPELEALADYLETLE